MLDAKIQEQLKVYFNNLQKPVELHAYLDQSSSSKEMARMLEQVASLSDKITYKEGTKSNVRRPSFQVTQTGQDTQVWFAAIPGGHEFSSFILALLQAGGHPTKITDDDLFKIEHLDGPLHFDVYISLSCHNCPDVVQALNIIALKNPQVTVNMIDGALFPEEVKERHVLSVPQVYVNGKSLFSGRKTLPEILQLFENQDDVALREAKRLNAKDPFDVLVLGAGPAGSTAAIYAARKGLRTGIIADRLGGQVHETSDIANVTSILSIEGPRLAANIESHLRDYDIDIMGFNRVEQVKKENDQWLVTTANGGTVKARTVIAATGARWRHLEVPGEKEYIGRGVCFCPHCDGPLFKNKDVVVVGGGNSGVEAAIDLAGICRSVTLLHRRDELTADKVLCDKARNTPNINIVCDTETLEVLGDGNQVTGIRYRDKCTQEEKVINCPGIFVLIGLLPNTEWVHDVLDTNDRNEIIVNHRGETSATGFFAAGDCTNTPYKQVVIAFGEGAKASLSAFDYLIRHS